MVHFRDMLGERFFEWVERPAAAGVYEEMLAALLDGDFASAVPAEAVEVREERSDGNRTVTHGSAGLGEPLEGTITKCASGTVLLRAFSSSGFDADAQDRFRAAVVLVAAHMRRLCTELYDRRVRERLYLTRRDAQLAAFVVYGKAVIPYNPTAVAYCDAHWGADETEHQLSDGHAEEFWKTIHASWRNPVDPKWAEISLDLGGGPVELIGIGRHDGGAVLLFNPPPREAPPTDIPMLTRRQRDIMEWIAEGKTSAEAAIILDISPRTVEKHLEAVFQRFGVENRVAAVRTYLDLKAGRDPRTSGIG